MHSATHYIVAFRKRLNIKMEKGRKRMKRGRRKRGERFLSALLIVAMVLGLIPQSAYAAGIDAGTEDAVSFYSGNCTITYKETGRWANYVTAEILIQNDGNQDIDTWKLEMQYDGKFENLWNAEIQSEESGVHTFVPKEYTAKIKKGKSVKFEWMASGTDVAPSAPSDIHLKDIRRQGDHTEEITINDTESIQRTEDKTENAESPEMENVKEESLQQSYVIPAKWHGFEYALFTSAKEKLELSVSDTRIRGNVHSNRDFLYRGSNLEMDGGVEAAGRIRIETAGDAQKITSQRENAVVIEMPDVTEELSEYAKAQGKKYDSAAYLGQENIVIDQPIYAEGTMFLNASTFLGQGIVYAKDSITYNIGSMATPEDSRIFLASEGNITLNGSDINLNAVLYAPNGTVTINCARVNLNGRIIAKNICINGSSLGIMQGEQDLDMVKFLFQPEWEIHTEGNLKENRKVILSLDEQTKRKQINEKSAEWKIVKEGEETVADFYAIDAEHSDDFHKELIFRKAGTYHIEAIVTADGAESVIEKEIVVEKDLEPVAGVLLETNYYSRNEEGKAEISIKDQSASPDGDEIGKRIWTICYDVDNNGSYSEQTILQEENAKEVTFETDKVGKYKVILTVIETFEDTIPQLLLEDAYLQDDTSELDGQSCVLEVGNEAPGAKLDIQKSKLFFHVENFQKSFYKKVLYLQTADLRGERVKMCEGRHRRFF